MHKDYVEGRLPGISDRYRAAVSCLYTTTPDSNFVIDVHPDNDRIMITSPCSGHGFKHSAAIGEALAEKDHLRQQPDRYQPGPFGKNSRRKK